MKIFEGEMLRRTFPTVLLQIVFKTIILLKVIVESIVNTDDIFKTSAWIRFPRGGMVVSQLFM